MARATWSFGSIVDNLIMTKMPASGAGFAYYTRVGRRENGKAVLQAWRRITIIVEERWTAASGELVVQASPKCSYVRLALE
jgi:hypothetical protein